MQRIIYRATTAQVARAPLRPVLAAAALSRFQPPRFTILPAAQQHVRLFHFSPASLQLSSSPAARSSSSLTDSTAANVDPRVIGHTISFGLRPSTGPATVSNIPTPVDPKLSASLNKLDAVHAEDARTAAHLAEHPPVKKRNILGRLWHDYGYVGVGTYLSIYVGTLGMLYVAVRSGALGADTVLNIVTKLGLESHFPSDISSKKGDFLIAWVATKLTEPVRASLTMAVTPRLARWVGMAPPKAETVAMLKQAVKKH